MFLKNLAFALSILSIVVSALEIKAQSLNSETFQTILSGQAEINQSNANLLTKQLLISPPRTLNLPATSITPIADKPAIAIPPISNTLNSASISSTASNSFLWSDNRGTWKVDQNNKPCAINTIQEPALDSCQ